MYFRFVGDGMEAHEKLMQALYAGVRQGGSGLSRTQLMRLAFPTIAELRGSGASWIWIACRIEHVREFGIEEPLPKPGDFDAHAPTGPVRGAFVRIRSTIGGGSGNLPAVRAGPPNSAAELPAPSGNRTPAPHSGSAAAPSQDYFEQIKLLKRQSI